MKQPRTFREAEEMARLACAVKTTMNNAPDGNMTAQIHNLSRSMDATNSAILAKIEMLDEKLKQQKILAKPDPPAPENHTLAKLDALVNGFTSEASVHQVEALLARIEQLEKAARKTEGGRVTPLAAYSAESPETRDVFKEIRQIKDTLLDMIQNLDRRMDARINGLARRQQPNREAELPRQRTREGRPVCYSCGRVGHVQQNCNQRYSREANQSFDLYQPHQQRRQPPDNNLPRSGYQSQRRDGLAPLDSRVLNSATVIKEALPHSHMAPLAHNDTCYVFPHSEGKFPGLNSGRNDLQVDNEIFQQRQNVLRFHREVASEGKVVHNTLTSEFFQASKQQSDDMQPHYKHAYANKEALKTSTADYAKNVTQGSLGTKAQAKPDVTVRPLGTSEVHKEEKKIKPKKKIDLECREKCETTGISTFKNPMRCTGAVVNAAANTISNSDSTEIVQSAPDLSAGHSSTSAGCGTETEISVPDPSLPQPNTSAGCGTETETSVPDPSLPQPSTSAGYEPDTKHGPPPGLSPSMPSTPAGCVSERVDLAPDPSPSPSIFAGYGENSPPSDPAPDQAPCEPTQNTTDQYHVISDGPRPRPLTVAAQLNGKDLWILVDTGASMSVIDKQFLRGLFDGKLPKLQRSELSDLTTASGETLPVLGMLKDSLHVARGIYPCELQVVKNLAYEAVMGRDFLRVNGAVINLKKGTLELDKIPEDQYITDTFCPVRAMALAVKSPNSESVIPAKLDSEFPPGRFGIIEPSQHLMERYQLQGASALAKITARHTILFRLINPASPWASPMVLVKKPNWF